MKRKLPLIVLLLVTLSCIFPHAKSNTGISPLLTQTAAARLEGTGIPSDVKNEQQILSSDWYVIQPGDTIASLSSRFKVSQQEILDQNPGIVTQHEITTLPPGKTLRIGSLISNNWENILFILPDSFFVYGPTQMDFDLDYFVNQSNGWLKNFIDNSSGNAVTGIQIIKGTSENYSISPKVLLALLEYHLHALSDPTKPSLFSLGNTEPNRTTLGKQLSWAANALNNGYYGWREGVQTHFSDFMGNQILPNPKNNASSVALIYYFSRFSSGTDLQQAVSETGFIRVYQNLFGAIDREADLKYPLVPADLKQPALNFPLEANIKWAYSGGPHSGWGIGFPYAAIDFAPPAENAGCDPSPYWVMAAADGVVSRLDGGSLILDLDGDGKSQTGWTILYLHLVTGEGIKIGSVIARGDLLGHPSCLGGNSSERNIHIARLYNGEWISAGGVIPLDLGGWVAAYGEKEYKGSLTKGRANLRSSSSGEWFSQIPIDK